MMNGISHFLEIENRQVVSFGPKSGWGQLTTLQEYPRKNVKNNNIFDLLYVLKI